MGHISKEIIYTIKHRCLTSPDKPAFPAAEYVHTQAFAYGVEILS